MEILFFIIGSFVFGLGLYLIYDHISYVRIAAETRGKIIGFKTSSGSKGSTIYNPVVQSYFGEFTGRYGSSNPSYQIGQEVDVIYVAGKTPRLKSNMPYYAGLFLMVFGGIFCVVFFSIFNFSVWNILYSLGTFMLIAFSFRRMLKSKGIDSLDELKEVVKNANKDTQDATKNIIREPAKIQEVQTKQAKATKIVGPVFTFVGLGVLALGVYLGVERYHFLQEAIPASGTVIDFHESRSDDGYTYYPIVEYSPNGSFDAITFRHDTGSNPPSYSRGEVVEVLHAPDNPNNAIIDKGIFNWAISIFVGLFGILFASAGVGASVSAFRKQRKQINL
ncbi:DUF3592 domain-containing protein [Gracilimonas sediminicola]|uniref:DUF3592 domain-containing protein n=1 Tax=Gracilimonas sediminicola TaxID=2952158 RepID=A0A9X2RGF6_9BACT|nr:DUF3592 domain-containing protein [Gracilimonas sediminicola]MCP9290924.1 DUF3592 domain-containing protein [Gracilimonas sediminicola]